MGIIPALLLFFGGGAEFNMYEGLMLISLLIDVERAVVFET